MDGNADLTVGFNVGLVPERGDEPRQAWDGRVAIGYPAYILPGVGGVPNLHADVSYAKYAKFCYFCLHLVRNCRRMLNACHRRVIRDTQLVRRRRLSSVALLVLVLVVPRRGLAVGDLHKRVCG